MMELSTPSLLAICGLFFAVAMLYSAVGHGGASGYLAVLSFFSVAPKSMSTTALILTLLVAAIAFILLMRWADVKKTSATSACFILVNAVAGLAGRFLRGNFEIGLLAPFLVAAFCGGLVGSHLGANLFSSRTLQRALGVVLIIAAYKLVVVVL